MNKYKECLWRVRIPFPKIDTGRTPKLSVLVYPSKKYGDKYGWELIQADKKSEEFVSPQTI